MIATHYARPRRIDDAIRLLARDGEARALAGGQSLLAAMRLRLSQPTLLVDLSGVDSLYGVHVDGQGVRIGAMTTHREIAESPLVQMRIPALAALAAGIGDTQIRNRGTIGGSIANADPAACHPAGVLGFGATIVTDRRDIAADAFFDGLFTTALEPAELIVAVRFPVLSDATYLKFDQPASRFALIGIAVSRSRSAVRVAVTGGGLGVYRERAAELALERTFSRESAQSVSFDAERLTADLHASREYRAHLARVLLARAVAGIEDGTIDAPRT